MRRRSLAIGICLLLICSVFITISLGVNVKVSKIEQPTNISNGNTLYVGGSGPDNYTKIQDAIDDAIDGDTVFVFNGTYYELVIVNKSINFIGENRNTTVIHCYGESWHDYAVYLEAPNITLTGFTLTGCHVLQTAGLCIISANNDVYNNIITNNRYGGIRILNRDAHGNCIHHNIIKNSPDWYGIFIYNTYNNKIFNNTINNCLLSIETYNMTNSSIYNNILNILFLDDSSSLNKVYRNFFSGRNQGLFIIDSNYNWICENSFVNNTSYGVQIIKSSKNNSIFHNNFIKNSNENAYDESNNIWDDGRYGNYWSDYKERYPSAKRSLLKPWMWNTPYEIPGGDNKDMCPLVNKWPDPRPRTITMDTLTNSPKWSRFFDMFPILQRLLDLIK